MFAALLRGALPSLRSLSSVRPAFLRAFPRTSVGFGTGSPPLSLSSTGAGAGGVALREKSCLKANKSAAKRFIVRGKGRIKRGKAGKSHNTGHKGRKRVNRLAYSAPIKEKAIEERMRVLIRA